MPSTRVDGWRAAGRTVTVGANGIHICFRRDGRIPVFVLLHGFPSSSFDWRGLLAEGREHAALAFDFLGFGLSSKPRDGDYSLFRQADLTVGADPPRARRPPRFIVAHDMGTSVATELMARDLRGELDPASSARCCSTAASCSSARGRRWGRSCFVRPQRRSSPG